VTAALVGISNLALNKFKQGLLVYIFTQCHQERLLGLLDFGGKKWKKRKKRKEREAVGRQLRLGSGRVLWLIACLVRRGKLQGCGLTWGEKGKSPVLLLKSTPKKMDPEGSFGDPRKNVVMAWTGMFGCRDAIAAPCLVGLKQSQGWL